MASGNLTFEIDFLNLLENETFNTSTCSWFPIWPFWSCLPEIKCFGHFLAFLDVKERSTFKACFSNKYHILCNIIICFCWFKKIHWSFYIFYDLAFLKLLMAKFGLLICLDLATLTCSVEKREGERVRKRYFTTFHRNRSIISNWKEKLVAGNFNTSCKITLWLFW